jgi:hypothetical protein
MKAGPARLRVPAGRLAAMTILRPILLIIGVLAVLMGLVWMG